MKRIDNLKSRMDECIWDVDASIQSVLSNYLVLAGAGLIENGLNHVLSEYGRRVGDVRIRRYVARTVSRHNSLNCKKIKDILEQFDPEWWRQIENNLSPADLEAVDSLKTLRDQIAHGRPNGTGFRTVEQYYSSAKRVISEISSVILSEEHAWD
ncbi:MAG: HEPN domain-containing protein [Parvularcula sp.]|nr:HEPN domain-containing protein [Parvularcula sp.]